MADARMEREIARAVAASQRHFFIEEKSEVTSGAAAKVAAKAVAKAEAVVRAETEANADAASSESDAPAKSAASRSALRATGWHARVATATIAVALAAMLLAL